MKSYISRLEGFVEMTNYKKTNTFIISILAILTLLIVFCKIASAEEKPKITGTYSDLRYIEEAGDLLGQELRIVFTNNGYKGTLQIAEGGGGEIFLFPVKEEGNKITFDIEGDTIYKGHFEGTVSKDGIKGVFIENSKYKTDINLPRRKSYWD